MKSKKETESSFLTVRLSLYTFVSVLIGGIVWRFVRPFYHAYRIRDWLRTESHYIQDYTLDINPLGYFEFQLNPNGESEISIENVHFQAPIRIAAEREFDPGLLSTLTDQKRHRRRLQTEIESVLTNTPGIFLYQDLDGEACAFEDAKKLVLEYRIYPDGLSQHELISGITAIASALRYVDEREAKIVEELQEQT